MIKYVLILLFIASCSQDPAMVQYGGDKFFGYNKALENEYKPVHVYPSSVVARPGMSIAEIAFLNKVDVTDVMQINNIKAKDFIFNEEMRIYLPNYIIHQVSFGEDILKISRRYGVKIDIIKSHNVIAVNSSLKPGQKLKIYVKRKSHFVKKEDLIATSDQKKHDITAQKSIAVKQNNILSKKTITQKYENKSNAQKKSLDHPKTKSGFIWPVKGKIISPFGKLDKGVKNTGINIGSKLHKPIIAVQNGEVAFAGSGVPGFGKLIIIKHANGWHSSYGHQHDNAVSKGEKVKMGDIIAYAGKSGNVKDVQLFFSLQKNKRPVDPMKYLP